MKPNIASTEPRVSDRRQPYAAPRLICYGSVKDIIQGGGGTKGDGGGKTTKACWIAEALYGVSDPRTMLLRSWTIREYERKGPWWLFVSAYRQWGRAVAKSIEDGHLPRRWVRPLFDFLLGKALDETARAIRAGR